MMFLTDWYKKNSAGEGVGFFQIGGGTAGDFPICVVPMMEQDLDGPVPRCGNTSARSPTRRLRTVLLRCRSEREDHMGKTGPGYAEIHRRIRRYDRRTAYLRLRIGLVERFDRRQAKGRECSSSFIIFACRQHRLSPVVPIVRPINGS